MTTLPLRHRFRHAVTGALFTVALACAGAAAAGPQEDYEAGYAAYRAGDIVGAMPLLRRAADAGHVDAQLQYGFILDWSEENEEAVRYYRMAADSGDPRGELELARMYLGGEGVERDPAIAREWIDRAAARDYGPAVTMLGHGSLSGTLGLPADEDAARRYFQRALELGDQHARGGLDELERRSAARRKAAAAGGQAKPR